MKKLKENGVHTAVDTCGFVSRTALDKVIPYTDVFLYDIKAYDEDVHIRCTAQSNKIILDNLLYPDSLVKNLEIRIPYVPDHNDCQIERIARFLSPFKHITKIWVLPYHNYADSKYEALGMTSSLPSRLPTDEEIQNAKNTVKSITAFAVLS